MPPSCGISEAVSGVKNSATTRRGSGFSGAQAGYSLPGDNRLTLVKLRYILVNSRAFAPTGPASGLVRCKPGVAFRNSVPVTGQDRRPRSLPEITMEDSFRGRPDGKPSAPGEGGAAIRTPSKGDSSSPGAAPPSDSPTLIDIPGHGSPEAAKVFPVRILRRWWTFPAAVPQIPRP